jgi:transposase
MRFDISGARIFIRPGSTDMRKAANGLAALAQEEMRQDVFSGNLYLFCSRSRKLLKGIWWDKSGFWLCQKRLEKEKWPWPRDKSEAEEISPEQLKMLLSGIDFWKAHKELKYEKVC